MNTKLFLGSIIVLALFLRIYQLGSVPPSPSLDEVSIGWNAYSILQTGADEYGTRFPILLRAYDDWRPALYVYLVIPFVKILGLNVLAVRLPSVILSFLTVLATYFLVKELLFKKFTSEVSSPSKAWGSRPAFGGTSTSEVLSLLTTFFLAISPWHIYISRLGHEVNAGLAFIVFATLFFLKATNFNTVQYFSRKGVFLVLATVFFVLSFYTYQSEKIFVPAIVLILVLIFGKQILAAKKAILLTTVLGVILLIPILKASLEPQALMRFQGTTAFSQDHELYRLSALKMLRDREEENTLGLIFDNRYLATFQIFLTNYFSHFDPRWLMTNFGEEKHKVPGMGLLYFWELPFLILGIYILASGKFPKTTKVLVFSWMLIAPLPASITSQSPHAMRAFNALPAFSTFTALGILQAFSCFNLIKSRTLKAFFVLCFLPFAVFNFFYFYHNYFFNFPREQSRSFQYALSKAISYVSQVESNYEKIIFSNKDDLYQSYMFFLFYSQYDPDLYQKQRGTVSGGFAETHYFGKFEFRPINWEKEERNPKILYIGTTQELPSNALKTFNYLNGEEGVRVAKR